MRHAIVIQHVGFEDLGTLEPVLRAADFAIESLQAGIADLTKLPDSDLLIVLGGPIGVYQLAEYPFLTDELRLIARRIHTGRPILGICLGAQLMAAALGAKVFPGKNGKEIGWAPVFQNSVVANNPLTSLFQPELKVLHWHGDTFELPTGATHLASSEHYKNQAFGLDKFALALQFHPEVTASQMERWFIGHAAELAQARISVPALRIASRLHAPVLEAAATRLWQDWLQLNFG